MRDAENRAKECEIFLINPPGAPPVARGAAGAAGMRHGTRAARPRGTAIGLCIM